jgi:hypothetical protein
MRSESTEHFTLSPRAGQTLSLGRYFQPLGWISMIFFRCFSLHKNNFCLGDDQADWYEKNIYSWRSWSTFYNESYGGFLNWMVYNGKSQSKMEQNWGEPYDSGKLHIISSSSPGCLTCFCSEDVSRQFRPAFGEHLGRRGQETSESPRMDCRISGVL